MVNTTSTEELYPPQFFSVESVREEGLVGKALTIKFIEVDNGQFGKRLKLSHAETKMVHTLNRSNAMALSKAFGDDFTGWIGKQYRIAVETKNAKDTLKVTPVTDRPF